MLKEKRGKGVGSAEREGRGEGEGFAVEVCVGRSGGCILMGLEWNGIRMGLGLD